MSEKIDWGKKAEKIYQIELPNKFIERFTRSLCSEHMFKKLWKIMMKAKICPWDMCLMNKKIQKEFGCTKNCKDINKCWRRFRKELEK